MIPYTLSELVLFGILYALLGWCVQTAIHAVRDARFVNPGFANLPLELHWGFLAAALLPVLPTLDDRPALQFLLVWVAVKCVREIARQFTREISPPRPRKVRFARHLAISASVWAVYLLIHPLLHALVTLVPDSVASVLAAILAAAVMADLACVILALKHRPVPHSADAVKDRTRRFGDRICSTIRTRLERAYPGILDAHSPSPVFARGICFDKLVWVFLISSFLGALIEMLYCRLTGGVWMNRSSVLYGPFSVVWGLGAVLLTVALRPLAGKADRHVFLAGFLIGGGYEYLCSVFTELVFGTVFWDYSWMPLNIGGRTNVLYCIFWGLLAVLWVKMLCPPMEAAIEKIPPLPGKIITWIILVLMVCNAVLTGAAMLRYTRRQIQPEPANVIEQHIDERFDDAFMESYWPNMKLTGTS
ncbi:MAG: putative ABC transporter permease [Oscillospiraceae bacterium]|nr:putative ABC transporter permease [Oscillospiraceae bacterium]